jgi:hypothetical protein
MTSVYLCPIDIEMVNAKRCSIHFQLDEDFVLMRPQHISSDHSSSMIHGMPEPVLMGFLAHKTPHVADFSFFHLVALDEDLTWLQALAHYRVDVLELRRFF